MVASLDSYPGNVACSSQCHCFQGVDGCTLIQPEWHAPGTLLLCVRCGRSACLLFTVVGSQTGLGTIVFKAGGFCSAARSVSPEVVGMSPHIVNLAGRCLHVPRHSPPPLRLPRLFRNWSLVCACLGGVPLCRRSIFSCQNLPTKISFRPDFRSQSMWVAMQEYPASPIPSASQSPCLDLDAVTVIRTRRRIIPPPALRLCPVPLLHPAPLFVWWCLPRTTRHGVSLLCCRLRRLCIYLPTVSSRTAFM